MAVDVNDRHAGAIVARVQGEAAIELSGYLYSESHSEYGVHRMHPDPERVWVYTQPTHRQTWRGWDGSGLIREQMGPARFFTVEGKRRWEAAGCPQLRSGLHQVVMAPGCMDNGEPRRRAAGLPTNLVRLRAAIAREPRGDRSAIEEEFAVIRRLLRTPEAPTDLCRALQQVLSGIPGIVEVGEVLDRAGRLGVGIEAELGGYLHRLVLDPEKGRLLGEQQTLTNPEFDYAPPGTLTGWAVYLREERVAVLPYDAPSVPEPPCRAGQTSLMREVQPGLTHVTGRDEPEATS